MTEINITYETLFDLLRREKERKEIQELDENFYNDVVAYLSAKKDITSHDIVQQKKADIQLTNVKKILKELYEKRERKVIEIALNKSRTGADIIDTAMLLTNEQNMYDEIRRTCDKFRKDILTNALLGNHKAARIEKPEKTAIQIRFITPVPKFMGKELETYGPFNAEEVVSMPAEIADVLVKKARAEIVND